MEIGKVLKDIFQLRLREQSEEGAKMMYFAMDCPCKGKNLDKLLQPAILTALYNKELHGFLLIRELSKNPMFAGTLPDRAGVYRYLKRMEGSGLLASNWETETETNKPRRVYTITSHGRECLANWLLALNNYMSSVEELTEQIERMIKQQ